MKRFYKFLMPLVAIVAMALPVNVAAQSNCDNGTITVATASASTATTSYFPAYNYYNYSASEVLVLASELEGLGGEIASMQFKPENLTSSDYYNNCQVYLGNSLLADLSGGWVQDTSMHLVFTGNLNFTTTDWQTITFDSTFNYTGNNLIVLVVRPLSPPTTAAAHAAAMPIRTATPFPSVLSPVVLPTVPLRPFPSTSSRVAMLPYLAPMSTMQPPPISVPTRPPSAGSTL